MNTRIPSALVGGVTAAALAALAMASPAASTSPTAHFRDLLRDLQPAQADPFDGAAAHVSIASGHRTSTVNLHVSGVTGAVGSTYGAHLHLGPCIAGNPAAALGHYNTDVLAGRTPVRISESTEVWLDFTVTDEGTGNAVAVVPFRIVPGTRSVVVHALATDHHTGTAGIRLACLPVAW